MTSRQRLAFELQKTAIDLRSDADRLAKLAEQVLSSGELAESLKFVGLDEQPPQPIPFLAASGWFVRRGEGKHAYLLGPYKTEVEAVRGSLLDRAALGEDVYGRQVDQLRARLAPSSASQGVQTQAPQAESVTSKGEKEAREALRLKVEWLQDRLSRIIRGWEQGYRTSRGVWESMERETATFLRQTREITERAWSSRTLQNVASAPAAGDTVSKGETPKSVECMGCGKKFDVPKDVESVECPGCNHWLILFRKPTRWAKQSLQGSVARSREFSEDSGDVISRAVRHAPYVTVAPIAQADGDPGDCHQPSSPSREPIAGEDRKSLKARARYSGD